MLDNFVEIVLYGFILACKSFFDALIKIYIIYLFSLLQAELLDFKIIKKIFKDRGNMGEGYPVTIYLCNLL